MYFKNNKWQMEPSVQWFPDNGNIQHIIAALQNTNTDTILKVVYYKLSRYAKCLRFWNFWQLSSSLSTKWLLAKHPQYRRNCSWIARRYKWYKYTFMVYMEGLSIHQSIKATTGLTRKILEKEKGSILTRSSFKISIGCLPVHLKIKIFLSLN